MSGKKHSERNLAFKSDRNIKAGKIKELAGLINKKIKNIPKNKMAFMRRDINLGLLFLIMAAILMFSGFTVYYQTTFKNISKNYELKLGELQKISNELESKRGQLNETSTQLQLKKQKEEDLSKKFTDVRSDKEQLEADKKALQAELSSTKTDLAGTKVQLANVQAQLSDVQNQFADVTTKYTKALADINNYVKKLADRDKEIACLLSNGGTSKSC